MFTLDFTVTLVSEGDSRGREYEVDGEQSQSLFMVNEKRVFGAPWYRGINVVNLDPALRTVIAADVSRPYMCYKYAYKHV